MDPEYGFLHIGKTGGTAIREAIYWHNDSHPEKPIAYFPHRFTLRLIAEQDLVRKLFFVVRDPVSRFISAFNSRLRKGKRGDREWSAEERAVFERFKTPNSLAEALSSPIDEDRKIALNAMDAIRHLRRSLAHFLGPPSLLERERERIFFIGHQEHLDEDFAVLRPLIGMDDEVRLPDDPLTAHRSPGTVDRTISELGAANIRRHYRDDYPIYDWCLKRRQEILASLGK